MNLFLLGLVVGFIAVLALEAVILLYVFKRLIRKSKSNSNSKSESSSSPPLDPQQSLDFAFNKKGVVWVLESDKIPKKKKDLLEVSPLRKYAQIKDGVLILSESDASHTPLPIQIPLKGCIIQAVSASTLASKKWAKKFPIRVENKASAIHNASRIIYIYLETSWEKESWCKALRLASCDDKKRLDWFAKLTEDFRSYLTSLNTGYPSFMKSPVGLIAEPMDRAMDRAMKFDGSSSKVRQFWKKLARKNSKPCLESKALYTSSLAREERKIFEKSRPSQDPVSGTSLVKSGLPKVPNYFVEETEEPSASTFSRSGSQSQFSVISDVDSEDRFPVDEGTLCWNLLISRLFFDAKGNAGMKSSIQARIQRTLSTMRIPSYIGEVICTDLDIGHLPPYIHCLRVLPGDMNEVWAFDVDIEYSGGLVLDVETRLEVCELDAQKGLVGANSESSSVGAVSPDLLQGFEYFGKQLNVSEETVGGQDQKDDGDPKLDGLKNQKSMPASTSGSKWKTIINSIAKQAPLSLSIRVASLRGTVRFRIKPPPSDQLWFSFTSMPDVEFELESSVGDHKITSGQVAMFLIGRFKTAIRETLVLPNCESICIPWMLAEKDDWVPQNVAPFIWRSQEANNDNTTTCESFSSQAGESKTNVDATRALSMTPERSSDLSIQHSNSLQELNTPLLAREEPKESNESKKKNVQECQSLSTSSSQSEKQNYTSEEEDSRAKKMGKRERMLDFRKKMGEKLEEKRRNIEEKSRNIVERMRGP